MRIAHLSDLHFGKHDAEVAAGLAEDIGRLKPDLVVISGDFTQVGNESEFREARAFLDSLPAPFFAVPGNHDVPTYNLIKRLLDPYEDYREFISDDLEPFLRMNGVALSGIKTSRRARWSLNWSDGSISRSQLRQLEADFADVPEDVVRIVVAHHPLLHPEEAMAREQKRVKRADLALQTFARLGVRLVLSGHFHMTYVRKHAHKGQIGIAEPDGPREAATAPILVAQTSSTMSTRLRGHPNAYNLIDIDGRTIEIKVREWQEGAWSTRETALAQA